MEKEKLNSLGKILPLLRDMQEGKEVLWINPEKKQDLEIPKGFCGLTMDDITDAEARLLRFAPFIRRCFPETEERQGLIESDLIEIPTMQKKMKESYGCLDSGRLLLKMDGYLPIAGSVKARGGIYEVLKHAEDLALSEGMLSKEDSYERFLDAEVQDFFAQYTIQVGSTGNLGMSIGIMSAAIGFQVIVHMSADARQWKKDLLRKHGVIVKEYPSDYSEAVTQGRALSDANPCSHFVDDENSKTLFLGYAVAAKRLSAQLEERGIKVDEKHPLCVYIPCGVGGAPGGITFGLKEIFGDAVHCFFVEPTQAPCMLVGMGTGLNQDISVQDIGLTGQTEADGLAVGRASGFVGSVMKPLLSGIGTIEDRKLYTYMRDLLETEDIFLEPSACAAFQGPIQLWNQESGVSYLNTIQKENAHHIIWSTGGKLVPEEVRKEYSTRSCAELVKNMSE